jgi:hypothetical protein
LFANTLGDVVTCHVIQQKQQALQSSIDTQLTPPGKLVVPPNASGINVVDVLLQISPHPVPKFVLQNPAATKQQ